MEEAIDRDPTIGIIGLKRKDLAESPNSPISFYVSELKMLPHQPGEKWIIVEDVHHVMGTCQMLAPALLEKVGFYFQKSLYGLDDSDISYRSKLSGFRNVFLPHIEIEHIDVGGDDYSNWKHQESSKVMHDYGIMCEMYRNGERSLYYDGGF
jgi:GT2 family glycosyltransferase